MKRSNKTERLEYRIVNTSQKESFSCWPVEKDILAGIESRIPEFDAQKIEEGYYRKLNDIYGDALVLVAYHRDEPIGFSASYMNIPEYRYRFSERVNLDIWVACVVPEHRGSGLMSCMMDLTEWWADDKHKGYKSMTLKTFQRFPGMIKLAEKKGFKVMSDDEKDGINYRKDLKRSLQGDFHKSEVFRKYGDRFDLALTWNVTEVRREQIRSIEYNRAPKMMGPDSYRVEFGSGHKEAFLWEYDMRGFTEGDTVEIGFNSQADMAWSLHPGLPLHFKKIDENS